MVKLEKHTKVKLLKAIRDGYFDGNQFPELAEERKFVEIELIDSPEQVDHSLLSDK